MPAVKILPATLAKEIQDISRSVLTQLENLEGLCSTLQTLGSAKGIEAIDPMDVGRTMGVIRMGLKDIHTGIEHIGSFAITPVRKTLK